jgi:hypothetical protein
MKRAEALRLAAGMIVAGATDLQTLCALLDDAGQLRLAAALRARLREPKPAAIGGVPKPNPEMWSEAAMRRAR